MSFHGPHRTNPYHWETLFYIIKLAVACMFFRMVRTLSGRWILSFLWNVLWTTRWLKFCQWPYCSLILTDQCSVLALKNSLGFQNRPSTSKTKLVFSVHWCTLLDKQCKIGAALTNCANSFPELRWQIERAGIINEMAGSGECFKCHYWWN